jgi:hypothetical protein
VNLVPAEAAHIPDLAARMREWDVIECRAMGHVPAEALRDGLSRSLWALTAMVDGKPEAMLGVAPRSMIEGTGVPWMLGTEAVYGGAREFVRYGRGIISEMEWSFPVLSNFVAAGNARAIGFLRHWGWRISSKRVSVGGVDFVEFSNGV